MPRYVQHHKGRRRAWVIERRGQSLVTLTGSTGAGRPSFRDYGTEERATEEMALRIEEKLADGWTLEDPNAAFEDGLGVPKAKRIRYHSVTEAAGLLKEALRRHEVTQPSASFTSLIKALRDFEKVRLRAKEVGWWYEGGSGKVGDIVDMVIGRQIYSLDDGMTRIDLRLQVELSDELDDDSWYQEKISVPELMRAIGDSIRGSHIRAIHVEAWD